MGQGEGIEGFSPQGLLKKSLDVILLGYFRIMNGKHKGLNTVCGMKITPLSELEMETEH